ncbi:TIGR00180 family glycosyltransferase, partial [Clostridium botulinum]|nr:TIGR00180 family glycosyltransferase [Clostridium botulinum]
MDMRFLEGDESALRKEKLILFGASKMGETVYSLLKDGYDIDYFCDNDKNKWGKELCGLKIISPEYLSKEEFKHSNIIITSMYYKEISKQLNRSGIYNYKIFKTWEIEEKTLYNLFLDLFYYDKLSKVHITGDKLNNTDLKKILFISQENLSEEWKFAKILKDKNIDVDLLRINGNNDECKNELFEKIYNINLLKDSLKKIDFSNYDVIHNFCYNLKDLNILKSLKKPMIYYLPSSIDNNNYFKSFTHDIINEKLNNCDKLIYDNPNRIYSLEDIESNKKLFLKINSKLSREDLEWNIEDIEKYCNIDNKIHIAYIIDESLYKINYRLLKEIFIKLADDNIHIHYYIEEDSDFQFESKYIHKEVINKKKFINELRKYDAALVLNDLRLRDEFVASTVIPKYFYYYVGANLPIIVNGLPLVGNLVEMRGIGDKIDFKGDILEQINHIRSIRYDKKIISEFLIESEEDTLINFYKKVKLDYELSNKKSDFKMDNIEKYKVAVLMPTKDRPRYLKRQLMYLTSMSDEEMDVYIYIADSSSKDIINNNKKFIKNLNNNKIQHFIYDKNTDFNHKILNTAQNIN